MPARSRAGPTLEAAVGTAWRPAWRLLEHPGGCKAVARVRVRGARALVLEPRPWSVATPPRLRLPILASALTLVPAAANPAHVELVMAHGPINTA